MTYVYRLAQCQHVGYTRLITTEADRYGFRYCSEGTCTMPTSTAKTVLFATGKDGKAVRQWPVAVFPNAPAAKSFATIYKLAVRSNDVAAVKALDPHVRLTESGDLLAEVKFSLMELPYAPTPDIEEDDAIDGTPAAA